MLWVWAMGLFQGVLEAGGFGDDVLLKAACYLRIVVVERGVFVAIVGVGLECFD